MKKIYQTENDFSLFVLRILLGAVFLPHGMQKVFGWFGGEGFTATMAGFEKMGIPALFALLAIAAEALGSLGLIAGFLTRIAALGIGINMAVAIALIHHRFGFFMNWLGRQQGEGFEYHVLVIAIAIALLIKGGGMWSIDRLISYKLQRPKLQSDKTATG